MGSIYQIDIAGTIFSTNANVPQITPTSFLPIANFNKGSFLAIESPIPGASGSSSNGSNLYDVAIFPGNRLDFYSGNGGAGTLQFATNTALAAEFFAQSSVLGGASLDIVGETYNAQARELDIQIDPSLAPTTAINAFLRSGGFLGFPDQIISGEIKIDFSPDLNQIAGSIFVLGNGSIEPGVYAYAASFSGTFAQTYQGLAEN